MRKRTDERSGPDLKLMSLEERSSRRTSSAQGCIGEASEPAPSSNDHALEALPGTSYRLGRRLVARATGEVFEAEHVDSKERLAATLLHAHMCQYEWSATAYRSEVLACGRIDSPFLVDVRDSTELPDGRVLVIMERLEGRTMRQAMREGLMKMDELIDLGRQICSGLGSAHDAGIVHLDLDPRHVMLVPQPSQRDRAVLFAFGSGQLLRDHGRNPRGTTPYSAPETDRGHGDARSDIYSLGCLLYELACGVTPFEGAKRDEPPVPPSQRTPARGIPRQFDAIVMRCLEPEPGARYQTMQELERVLGVLQAKLRTEARAGADAQAQDQPGTSPARPAQRDGEGAARGRTRREWSPLRLLGSLFGRTPTADEHQAAAE